MSRERYYAQAEGYTSRGGQRWDSERFAVERDRARYGSGERERFEERDTRVTRDGFGGRTRERSVDEIYERRGPRGYEDDRYERRTYYDDEPRLERERPVGRERNITIEKEREREVYSPSPPRRPFTRPAFLRRQSSLDTFDRKPLTRYVEREEYATSPRYREDIRVPPLTPIPLPRSRGLPPPRRYERDYEEIEIAEPDFYGDDQYRGYPERVREREIIRTKRRSRSRESRGSRSHKSSVRSASSSSSDTTVVSVRNEFPKKGKTRMPARLVNKRAIADLGYPFEEEGDTIIILKALGRENIDEVIKLSEDYKVSEKIEFEKISRSEGGTVIEERREEVYTRPVPSPAIYTIPPPPGNLEIIRDTKIIEGGHHHHHGNPIIIDAGPVETSDPIPVGPLALALPVSRTKDERAIRAEIKALEAEREALRAEKRADREIRKADRIRREGRVSEGDLVLYERERIDTPSEEYTVVRRERIEEPEGGVRIEKDRKGPPPKLVRAMLKTLT